MKTTAEIYNIISTEEATFTELQDLQPSVDDSQTLAFDLTTTSQVAEHRRWKWCFAYAASLLTGFWDVFKAEIETIAAKSEGGTIPWYLDKCFDFRYGYTLAWNALTKTFEWPSATLADIATSNVVKRAAVLTAGQILKVKVAGDDGSGNPQALTTLQFNAFKSYFSNFILYPGVYVEYTNGGGDNLRVNLAVFYNPLVLDSNGDRLLTSGNPVEEAIAAYISGVDFNGTLRVSKIGDAIQAAEGVVDFKLNSVEREVSTGVWQAIDVSEIAPSGYYLFDDSSSTITYTISDDI